MNETARLTVVRKQRESDGVVSLALADPEGGELEMWTPGAHIDLILPSGAVRQYSLCGDPSDRRVYRIAVLREPDGRGGSREVHDSVQVGDVIGVGGPRNHFELAAADSYLFIAGGIGITPILVHVREVARQGGDWQLVYGGRSRASMAFVDELLDLGADRVSIAPQDEVGLLDLERILQPRPGTMVYCCGPTALLDAVEARCATWPEGSLRTERFVASAEAQRTGDHGFEVVLSRTGQTFRVEPDATILQTLVDAGLEPPHSCCEGLCGTCITDVLEGEPDHRDELLSPTERERGDVMMICVSRARGERLVLDL